MSRKGYFLSTFACMGAASLALVLHRWWTGRYESKKRARVAVSSRPFYSDDI